MRVQDPEATRDTGDRKTGARRGLPGVFPGFFDGGEGAGGEHDEGDPSRPGVVFLVRRQREEEQGEGGVDGEQPRGAAAEFEAEDVAGYVFAGGVIEVEVDGLAGIFTQVLEPGVAGLPGQDECGGKEEAPGEDPNDGETQ